MSASVCPRCGSPLPAESSVCGKCAGKAAAAKPPAKPGPPTLPIVLLGGGLVLVLVLVYLWQRPSSPRGPAGEAAAPPAPAAATGTQAEAGATAETAISPEAAAPPVRVVEAPPPAPAGAEAPPAGAPASATGPASRPPAAATGLAAPPAAPPTPPIYKTYETREYLVFDVSPEEARIRVDGKDVGTCDEWDDAGGGKKYAFPKPGVHYVKLSLEKHETRWIKVVVDPKAGEKTVHVDFELKKAKD